MKRPLASNVDAVAKIPYTTEGDIYFHWYFDDLWRNKLVKYQPSSRNHEIILLPQDISMMYCAICQISQDIFKFSWEDKNIPTQVFKIQNLSSGMPNQKAMQPFDSYI